MNRRFVMIDNNDEAINVMARRLGTGGVRYADESLEPLAIELPPSSQLGLFG